MTSKIKTWQKKIHPYMKRLIATTNDPEIITDLYVIQQGFEYGFKPATLELLQKYVRMQYQEELQTIYQKMKEYGM